MSRHSSRHPLRARAPFSSSTSHHVRRSGGRCFTTHHYRPRSSSVGAQSRGPGAANGLRSAAPPAPVPARLALLQHGSLVWLRFRGQTARVAGLGPTRGKQAQRSPSFHGVLDLLLHNLFVHGFQDPRPRPCRKIQQRRAPVRQGSFLRPGSCRSSRPTSCDVLARGPAFANGPLAPHPHPPCDDGMREPAPLAPPWTTRMI